jgi:hypothetical protein
MSAARFAVSSYHFWEFCGKALFKVARSPTENMGQIFPGKAFNKCTVALDGSLYLGVWGRGWETEF